MPTSTLSMRSPRCRRSSCRSCSGGRRAALTPAWHHRPMRDALVAVSELTPEAIRARIGRDRPGLHGTRRSTSTRACPRGSASRSWSRSRPSTRSARSRAAGRGSPMRGLAGEGSDRTGPAGRVRLGRQLRPGRRVRRTGPRRPGRRVLLDARQSREGRPDARARRDGDRGRATTSTTRAAARRRTRPSTGPQLLVDGDDPRISTGAATLALEVTDAVEAGALPMPVARSGAGRQRRADQRRRLVAAARRAATAASSASRPRPPRR